MMWAAWLLTTQDRAGELKRLFCGFGLLLSLPKIGNSLFFSLDIAQAPVPIS